MILREHVALGNAIYRTTVAEEATLRLPLTLSMRYRLPTSRVYLTRICCLGVCLPFWRQMSPRRGLATRKLAMLRGTMDTWREIPFAPATPFVVRWSVPNSYPVTLIWNITCQNSLGSIINMSDAQP